jgi:hypothetical protein
MPQSTNLNKSPYFDDFSESNDYYKVLFKPGVTVQTRELTTLQSILQNQIEKFGNSFFNDGGVVIPGGYKYDNNFTAVEIESTYNGIDVESYYSNLIGKEIQGKLSNIKAKVVKVLSKLDSKRESTTLYINYLSSSNTTDTTSFTDQVFFDGEELIVLEDLQVGNSYIFTNSEFAKVSSFVNRVSTSISSAAKIDSGVYFVRGYFVNVNEDTIILDQYSNTPSYRVGLQIVESLVNSDEDSSLNDNAQGFSNYAAPGADRLKITLSLIKKPLDDFNDNDFIELFRVTNGLLQTIKKNDSLNSINDILARRTFDESGNYYVYPYSIEATESLNNYLGNGGIYLDTQKTQDGSTPSADLGLLKVSPGKSYVKGYEISTGSVLLDYPKPRETKTVNSSSSFYGGDLIRINNVFNSPNIGLSTSDTISLMNQRLENGVALGSTIGLARVYDFESNNTSYSSPSSQFNLYLFDIQTYTNLTLSGSVASINVGSFIRGNNSGATGYVKVVTTGSNINLYQVSGKFFVGESLTVDGVEVVQTIQTITDYSINDVKSVYQPITSFRGDSVLSKGYSIIGPFTFNIDAGITTVTSDNGSSFASALNVNDVISYSISGINSAIYVGVTSIYASKNKIEIVGLSTVTNICSGDIGTGTYQIQNLNLIRPTIVINKEESSSLYSKLSNSNISNVDTLNTNIYIKKQNTLSRTGTTLTLPTLTGNYVYTSFDEERYLLSNSDETLENLSNATFTYTNGNKDLTISGLTNFTGTSYIISTQIKSKVTSKFKKLNRCFVSTVTNTKYTEPKNVGLAATTVYGVRVEDNEISLNVADAIQVHGIFESSTTSDAALPYIALSGISGPLSNTNDLIVGEVAVGADSGAVAIYAQQKTTTQIYLVYKNNKSFISGEIVTFQESGYTATVSSVTSGDKNIVNDFIFDNGQRKQYYDFSRLIRKDNSKEPSGRLKIVFDYFSFESTDNGDIITSNSYPSSVDKNLIPVFESIRNTDAIDVRPKVQSYTLSNLISPFDFSSRNFSNYGGNAAQILASNENFVFDYDFYLGRIDKITLDKIGNFNLVLGQPSESPTVPTISNEVLDVATIVGKPYVYNVQTDIIINLTDNKRYTMSDLRGIENRVSNLEYYTSLSLLELSVKDLQIEDKDGFNRFKSGFFVDNFDSYNFSNTESLIYDATISNNTLSSPIQKDRVDLTLYSDDSEVTSSEINLSNTNSNNLRLTGKSLTLNYSEIEYASQKFASRVININPYNVTTWSGNLTLNPSSDRWEVQLQKSETRWGHHVTQRYVTYRETPNIRSRNIEFSSTRLKPNTRFKLLFDSKDITSNFNGSTYVFPKLLEITGVSKAFEVGETVVVYPPAGSPENTIQCQFRVCVPNHKSGPYNSPTSTYTINPYNPSVGLSTIYGPQSSTINIDTASLQVSNVSSFFGNIEKNSILVGSQSGATATVSDIKLVSDDNGTLIGSIFIPNPLTSQTKFNTGISPVRVLEYQSQGLPGEKISECVSNFTSKGDEITSVTVTWGDPIAQSFIISEETGIFPSSVDIFFASKDTTIPVSLQVREVVNGYPGGSDKIVGNLEKVLFPSQINISQDASVATTFTFNDLTRLEGGREYALVLISDSNNYTVWTSRIGEVEITTANKPEVEKIIINKQPSLGSLFKSQNSTTWNAVQTDDLKFNLKRCDFITSGGTSRFYNSKANVLSVDNLLPQNPIAITTGFSAPNDGNYMLISHPNHGLNYPNSKVKISGVQSDILPVKITVGYGLTDTGSISVASTSIFSTFEGATVSPTNPGYIVIDGEIIEYQGVGTNQLTTIARSIDSTSKVNHPVNSLAYKYEFNRVSLRSINTEHFVDSGANSTITLDSYYINVPTTFKDSKFGGGNSVYATKNKLFNTVELNPNFINISNGTNVAASVRTVFGTSANGTEISYTDAGYSALDATGKTIFNTVRMVSSEENENVFLNATEFVGNKSLTLDLTFDTNSSNISPIVDIDQAFLTTKNYRINQPIVGVGYTSDNRVSSNTLDPHAFVHITNPIKLINPANSLKVYVDVYRPKDADVRVLYKIFRNDTPDVDQQWEFFPGYSNLDVNGNVINPSYNNGLSDSLMPISKENEYLEYQYTIDNLPEFTGFEIKIIGSSSNQTQSPLIKRLRTIALK